MKKEGKEVKINDLLEGYPETRLISTQEFDAEIYDFRTKKMPHEKPWFVLFYAPWCGHSKALLPIWRKLATDLKEVVNMVGVDCTDRENTDSICKEQFSVTGYPTVFYFHDNKMI